MVWSFWVGLLEVVVCFGVGCVAVSDAVDLPPVSSSTDPERTDGWTITVSLTDMKIDAVPNMAATAFSREGFVSGTATLTADGRGKSRAPVTAGELRAFAQIGCQI